jgi:hypothetical protein
LSFPFCFGLRYNENDIVPGAQTERWGNAWPVRGLLGGKDLAGRIVKTNQHSSPGIHKST